MKVQHSEFLDLFNRQRRNLLVTSLLLFFAKSYGLQYPEMNILGNKFEFETPLDVSFLLLIFLIYFLLRYYQFFRDIGDKGFYKEFEVRSRKLGAERAEKVFKAKYKNDFNKKISKSKLYDLKSWAAVVEYKTEGNAPVYQEKILLGKFDQLLIFIQVWWSITIHTPLVTEFYLPFVLGLLALSYYLYN